MTEGRSLPRVFLVLGRRGHVVHQAFIAVGLFSVYQAKIVGPRRVWGVLHETWVQCFSRQRFDVVMTDTLEYLPLAWLISKIKRIPLIVRERGDGWAEVNQKERVGGYSLPGARKVMDFYSVVLRKCDAVVPVCSYLGGKVCENAQIDPEKVHVVPISVELSDCNVLSRENALRKMGFGREKIILVVTNFRYPDKVKKIEEYMPVLLDVLKSDDNSVLAIAGGGPYQARFEGSVRTQDIVDEDRIKIMGFVSDMSSLYAASSVVVYLTGLDALPRAILESHAAGLPVVANPFGGIPEIIEDGVNGYLIDDEADFTRKMKKLLCDDELCKRVGQEARASVVDNYSPEVVGKRWIEVLGKILEQTR